MVRGLYLLSCFYMFLCGICGKRGYLVICCIWKKIVFVFVICVPHSVATLCCAFAAMKTDCVKTIIPLGTLKNLTN